MRTLKISVIGGGLDYFDEFNRPDVKHQGVISRMEQEGVSVGKFKDKLKSDGTYNLLSDSAFFGIMLRLAGEEEKVSEIIKDKGFHKDLTEMRESLRIRLHGRPWVEFFSARKRSSFATAKDVNLNALTISECHNLHHVFAKEIAEAFGTKNAGEIYSLCHETPLQPDNLEKRLLDLSKRFMKLNSHYYAGIGGKQAPGHKFLQVNSEKCSRGLLAAKSAGATNEARTAFYDKSILKFKEVKDAGSDDDVSMPICKIGDEFFIKDGELVFSEHAVSALERICSRLETEMNNDEFKAEFAKINSAGILPKTTKSWAPDKVPLVTHAAGRMLKFNFDMYVDVNERMYQSIVNGPQLAEFGKGAIVTASLTDELEVPSRTEKSLTYSVKTKNVAGFEDIVLMDDGDNVSVSYNEYVFEKADACEKDVHALVTRLFDKGVPDQASACISGKNEITIRSRIFRGFKSGQTIQIKSGPNTFTYTFKKHKDVVMKIGSVMRLSSVFCYDGRAKGMKHNTVQRNGQLDLSLFAKHLKDNCGMVVDFDSMRESAEVAGYGKLNDKFYAGSVFRAEIKVQITNSYLAAKAIINGIGRRRSYGFGYIKIEKI